MLLGLKVIQRLYLDLQIVELEFGELLHVLLVLADGGDEGCLVFLLLQHVPMLILRLQVNGSARNEGDLQGLNGLFEFGNVAGTREHEVYQHFLREFRMSLLVLHGLLEVFGSHVVHHVIDIIMVNDVVI